MWWLSQSSEKMSPLRPQILGHGPCTPCSVRMLGKQPDQLGTAVARFCSPVQTKSSCWGVCLPCWQSPGWGEVEVGSIPMSNFCENDTLSEITKIYLTPSKSVVTPGRAPSAVPALFPMARGQLEDMHVTARLTSHFLYVPLSGGEVISDLHARRENSSTSPTPTCGLMTHRPGMLPAFLTKALSMVSCHFLAIFSSLCLLMIPRWLTFRGFDICPAVLCSVIKPENQKR